MNEVQSSIHSYTVGIIVLGLQFQNILAIQMKNFVSEPCDNNNTVDLEDIALSSNGSTWTVTGKLSVASTLDALIKAIIKMERRIFYQWVKIPCVGNFGSCKYSDVCTLVDEYASCEENRNDEQTIPCKCPIHQGVYIIKMESDHSKISKLEPALKGNYRASLRMFKNDKSIVCYNFKFKLFS